MRCDDICNCQLELKVNPDDDIREEMDTTLDLTEIIDKDKIIDDIGYWAQYFSRYEGIFAYVYTIQLCICVLSILDLKYIV